MIQIAVQSGVAFQTQRVNLDGTDFLLTLNWSMRVGAWFMSLATLDNEPIFSGVKVVSNRPLATRYEYDERMPPGRFVALDQSNKIDQAGFDDLTAVVPLFYVTAEDRAEP